MNYQILIESPSGAILVVSARSSGQLKFGYFFFWSALGQTIKFSADYMNRRIRCAVTRTALEELSGSPNPLHPADLERVFEQHRQEIERIAAEKIIGGHFQDDSPVLIRAVDLRP